MSFSLTTGNFDVQGSINKFIVENLLTNKPDWTNDLPINFDYPNQPLVFPSFSVTHLPSNEVQRYGGDGVGGGNKGVLETAIADISCWVDSTNAQDYQMKLRQMVDMVKKLFRQNVDIPILGLYSSVTAPSQTGYIVKVRSIRETPSSPDPNPAIKRVRILVSYNWVQRF